MHYNVEAAGVWVECIRLRKPVIHNDYKSLPAPRRKGLPAGHAEVVRELVVPVYRGNRVVSILGIGNKSSDYNERDVEVVSYLADVVWEIVKRKQAEENLQQAHEHLSLQLAEIEQLKDELQEQAIRDPLTGLFNRRYLDETITREIKRAERENDSLSVIIADIDHFKLTNDTHGHQTGDKFLTKIASLMMTNARISDIVCRYGGEEFLLVMPGTDLASAVKRAEEMRQLCAGIIIPHEGNELSVTLSFGVATYPVHGENADVITVKADKALYSSKARGRNCVTAWNFDSHAEI
jgi:diguanylate cyclase (GGDEF)-like protein